VYQQSVLDCWNAGWNDGSFLKEDDRKSDGVVKPDATMSASCGYLFILIKLAISIPN